MRVGMIGTGAIAAKHAQAYRNIGYEIVACTNTTESRGREFAAATGAEFFATAEEVCNDPRVDFVDVCTMPDYRLQVIEMCARNGKHVLVQKPMAIALDTAERMILLAQDADITLGVVSQHRFDDSAIFLRKAIAEGRLGEILQADAYVKWYRSAEYYSRPIKGSWAVEGGGALINQGIHQVDLLLYLAGAVDEVSGYWKLGALHRIESEDLVTAVMHYASGAIGVIQAATAIWPGYPERIEIHGTKGSAIITGDRLTTWDVKDDSGEPAPVVGAGASGASDPMAISLVPFERQLKDFGDACTQRRPPACSGVDGYRALQLVQSIYTSCREARRVSIPAVHF
ncbi:Gfo/Idh/MocA family protein [Silvibacterium acidisoli]|uniref:Gfo/Idh/MocA family protein n=1 Tax=Acidobacteriaceae bacterium ZG23-2 TaxID=2883246 RepID=UPI00406D3781